MAVAALKHSSSPASARHHPRSGRPVRLWLYGLAALVVLMVAIGGATRLTGSGLSITEWRPVTGAVPPLSERGWAEEFGKYRDSSQYRNLNRGMEMDEFRAIYWWEWSHRQLGRLIGLCFALPLAWFWWTRRVSGGFAAKLLGIGALGGLQATIGWIMVASGLEPGMTAVAPVKLALHLLVAAGILALLVAIAAGHGTGRAGEETEPPGGRLAARIFVALVFVQIGLGGLVAGSKAGLTYNTWPLMDGRLAPPAESLFAIRPWFENLVDNPALVQLDHRLAAYLVVACALAQAVWWGRSGGRRGAARTATVAALALAQAGLGIATLLLAVPLWAGLAHQLLAMALLAAAVVHARRCGEPSRTADPVKLTAGVFQAS